MSAGRREPEGASDSAPDRGVERLRDLHGRTLVLPSVLSADFAALAASIGPLEEAGAPVLHLDVMDGHFVPNITFGPPLVRSIRKHSKAFLDTHLMITDPLRYLEPFARAGSDLCTVHAETPAGPAAVSGEARRLGIGLGVAIRPSTRLEEAVERWAGLVDLILVMSVEPGFEGQKFDPEAPARLRRTAEICSRLGVRPILEVDGGINLETAPLVLSAGARWLVAGSAIFRTPDPVAAWRAMSRAGEGR
jgi:ribulose-phosphate 3-epimerase